MQVYRPISTSKEGSLMSTKRSVIPAITLFIFFVSGLSARASEVDELKATVQAMQKSIEQMI